MIFVYISTFTQCENPLFYKGTKIGQASECFIYWRDTSKNDTWGLNFTSPVDAKQFRECCVSKQIGRKINNYNNLKIIY